MGSSSRQAFPLLQSAEFAAIAAASAYRSSAAAMTAAADSCYWWVSVQVQAEVAI